MLKLSPSRFAPDPYSVYIEHPDHDRVPYFILAGRFYRALDAGQIAPQHRNADTAEEFAAALDDAGLIRGWRH
jgi:hypothetical protein